MGVAERFYEAFMVRDHYTMGLLYAEHATFSDPVFPLLNARGARMMWNMLLTRAEDLGIEVKIIEDSPAHASVDWVAHYTFGATGRPVVNRVHTEMALSNGRIVRQVDSFSLWRWSRQALGASNGALQRAVAAAVEGLGAGNSVYESLLLSASAASAQQGFQQLSGEIYPALGSMLINDSRQLRDAVGERLHDANATQSNGWIKALGAWGATNSGNDTSRYSTSIGGLLAGVDGALDEQTRIGLVTGYSDSSLSMGSGTHSSAKVDSYHLGAYAGRELGAWRLSTGAAYSWHRADVKRDLQYGDVSGKQKAKVDAATTQVFGEAAYRLHLQPLALEPFANLAYVHLDTEGFTEKGDAAALKSSGDQRDAVLSTLGVRAIKTFNLSPAQSLDVSGHLGWQHSLSDIDSDQHLRFASGGTPYSDGSVGVGACGTNKCPSAGCGQGGKVPMVGAGLGAPEATCRRRRVGPCTTCIAGVNGIATAPQHVRGSCTAQ